MIPSFGKKLSDNADLFHQVWDWTSNSLELRRDTVDAPADADVEPAPAG